jgi:hypothetical protein
LSSTPLQRIWIEPMVAGEVMVGLKTVQITSLGLPTVESTR